MTVIATGFERKEQQRAPAPVQSLPAGKDAQDIPTIIRNRWEQERMARVRTTERVEISEDQYDIPAFLRRKAE